MSKSLASMEATADIYKLEASFQHLEKEYGAIREREVRPMGLGWYAYRAPDKHQSGNTQEVVLFMREDVFLRRFGFLPNCFTIIQGSERWPRPTFSLIRQ